MTTQNTAITAYSGREDVRAESADAPRSVSEIEDGILPQTLSGLFDAAFDLYKRHFTTIALCTACIYLPTLAIYDIMQKLWLSPLLVLMQESKGDAADLAGLKVGLLYLAAISVLAFGLVLASGPATAAVAECSQDRPITVREAFRRAAPAFPRLAAHGIAALLATLFTAAAAFFVTLMGIGAVAIAFSAVNIPALATLAAFLIVAALLIVPYVCACGLLARFFLMTPALTVLENLPLGALIERNGNLARKSSFRRVWLAAIFLPLVTIGLQILVAYAAESVIDALHFSPFLAFTVQSGAGALFSFLLQPYWIIFLCLLYFDCRVRRDGLDVSRLADLAGLPHPAGPVPGSPTLAVPLTIYSVAPAAHNAMIPPMPYQPGIPPANFPPGGRRP